MNLARSASFPSDGSALITVASEQVLRWPLRFDTDVLHIGPPKRILPDSLYDFWRGWLSTDGKTLVLSVNLRQALVVGLDNSVKCTGLEWS